MSCYKHINDFIVLLCIPLFSMCSEPILEETDYFELSIENKVELPATATTEVIDVKVNNSDWTFIKKGEWLKVNKNPDQIILRSSINDKPEPRTAELLILSGKRSKKLYIIQQGVQPTFVLSQKSVELNFLSKTININVSSNATVWQAKTNVDWVHLDPLYKIGSLNVDIDENPTYEERVGKIYFSSEDFGEKEFTIVQSGKIYFLLPSFNFQANNLAIREFEFSRGSSVQSAPDGFFNTRNWSFQPSSDVIKRVNYLIFQPDKNSDKEYYKHSYILPYDAKLFQNKRELELAKRFLEANGFVSGEEEGYFMNWKERVEAIITIGEQSKISFNYKPEETKEYKALINLPKDYEKISTKDELLAWEAQNKGTLNNEMSVLDPKSKSHTYWFDVKGGGNLISRVYTVSNNQISVWSYLYSDKNLALFEHGGTDFLTQNFLKLAKKEGYVYRQEMDYNIYEFYNMELKTNMFVRFVKFAGFSTPTLEIQMQRF